ncbi:MAG: helix-turn-helix domain-containing protein [Candidatus Binataceae bacterium]
MTSQEDVFTINELSQYLKVHPTTIYRLLSEGRLPGFRVGSSWRFSRNAIAKWEESQVAKFDGTAPPPPKTSRKKVRKARK